MGPVELLSFHGWHLDAGCCDYGQGFALLPHGGRVLYLKGDKVRLSLAQSLRLESDLRPGLTSGSAPSCVVTVSHLSHFSEPQVSDCAPGPRCGRDAAPWASSQRVLRQWVWPGSWYVCVWGAPQVSGALGAAEGTGPASGSAEAGDRLFSHGGGIRGQRC